MTQNSAARSDKELAPIFLVGSERSGTTLLRLMLDHHPEIAFNLDSEYLVAQISDSGEFPDVAAYCRMLADDRGFRHSRFAIDDRLDFPSLLDDFLRQKRERDGKKFSGSTVHLEFDKLRYVWPRARYIYLFRDGRDVASSVIQMGWAGNVYVAAGWWLDAEHEWAQLKSTLEEGRWIEVRYEDLTAHPQEQLRRICGFIGVEYSERMFDYVGNSTYSWPDPQQNFKWRRDMRAKDVRLIEARIGPRLAARGYELRCGSAPRISATRERWIRLHSQWRTLRYKVATYGFWLFAVELVSRRLGWTKVHTAARRAVDEIIDRNLK